MAITLDPLSYSSFYLDCYSDQVRLSSATCFFVKRCKQTFLVTNWHVVSGKDNQTKKCLDSRGLCPTKVAVSIYKQSEYVERVMLDVPLYNDRAPVWLEHPIHHEMVDVVAIPVTIPEGQDVCYVEDRIEMHNENTHANIKDDVFILGFPFGISEGEGFPIWKRASIASEPALDIHELPLMYVDTASRPGMSGSPVIYKEKRPVSLGKKDTNGGLIVESNYFMEFVGVYSGRIGVEDEVKAQLGKVWKKQSIEDIVRQFKTE